MARTRATEVQAGWHKSTGPVEFSYSADVWPDEKWKWVQLFCRIPNTYARWDGNTFEAIHFPASYETDENDKTEREWFIACEQLFR